MNQKHRVQKLLSNYGYCSRREAEKLIEKGCVKVNGKTISLGDKAFETDSIAVNGKKVAKEKNLYFAFNKPAKCVTALRDPYYKTIMDYINIKERVFPVGRLDFNTSGLLILTNDGDFSNKIMHPRYEVTKTYVVELNKAVEEHVLKKIERGIELEDGKTAPAKIKQLQGNLLEITIHEGKNRIIRRMMKKVGYRTKSLQRVRIGKLDLGTLKIGRWRVLHSADRAKLFQ